MTKSQVLLLQKCIRAVRFAQQAKETNDRDSYRWHDYELVEVGRINGVNPSSAASLVHSGVLVYDMPTNANEHTHAHVRLPQLDEQNGHSFRERG